MFTFKEIKNNERPLSPINVKHVFNVIFIVMSQMISSSAIRSIFF